MTALAWAHEQDRWIAVFERQITDRLAWAVGFIRAHRDQPERLITHFESLVILLNEAQSRAHLQSIALELIEALHPWPVRWGHWDAWGQKLRFAIEAAERLAAINLQIKFMAELAAMLSRPMHQHDARALSEQALQLALRQRALQPWAVAGAAQVAAAHKSGQIEQARRLLANLDATWPDLAASASDLERVSARALLDFQRIDLMTRAGQSEALAACHALIAALEAQPGIELELLAEAYSTLGITLFRGEAYPAALTALERATDLRILSRDPVQELNERTNIGLVALWAGELTKSTAALQHSVVLAERLNLRRLVYATLSTLSAAYLARGQFDAALECAARAYNLAEEANDQVERARVINNRAAILLFTGQYESARQDFQIFLTQFMAQARPAVQIGLYLDMALADYYLGDLAQAEANIQRALELGQPVRRGLRLLTNRLRA